VDAACNAQARATAALAQRLRSVPWTGGRRCDEPGGRALSAAGKTHWYSWCRIFHWPAPDLDAVCAALVSRDVVPIVLWAQHEFDGWPRAGLAELQDLESGQPPHRVVSARARQCNAAARGARRSELRTRFAAYGWRPFFFPGRVRGQGPECLLPWRGSALILREMVDDHFPHQSPLSRQAGEGRG